MLQERSRIIATYLRFKGFHRSYIVIPPWTLTQRTQRRVRYVWTRCRIKMISIRCHVITNIIISVSKDWSLRPHMSLWNVPCVDPWMSRDRWIPSYRIKRILRDGFTEIDDVLKRRSKERDVRIFRYSWIMGVVGRIVKKCCRNRSIKYMRTIWDMSWKPRIIGIRKCIC